MPRKQAPWPGCLPSLLTHLMMIIATNWLAFRQEWTLRRGAAGWRASRTRSTQRHAGAVSARHA